MLPSNIPSESGRGPLGETRFPPERSHGRSPYRSAERFAICDGRQFSQQQTEQTKKPSLAERLFCLELPGRFELPVVRCLRQPTTVAIQYALRAELGSSHSSRPNKQKSRPLRNGFLVWSCPADSNCRLSVACGNQQPLRSNTRFARRSAVLAAADRTNKKAVPCGTAFLFGAVEQIRTADLVITNDVLCLLSYNSKMATVNGLEPSTSSVTG